MSQSQQHGLKNTPTGGVGTGLESEFPKSECKNRFLVGSEHVLRIFIFPSFTESSSAPNNVLVFNNKAITFVYRREWHASCKKVSKRPIPFVGESLPRVSGGYKDSLFILSLSFSCSSTANRQFRLPKRRSTLGESPVYLWFPRIFGGSQCDFSGITVQH